MISLLAAAAVSFILDGGDVQAPGVLTPREEQAAAAAVARVKHVSDGVAADFLAIGSAALYDLGATVWMFDRCPTCYEGNPLLRGSSREMTAIKVVTVKTAITLVGLGVSYKLRSSGHDNAAKWFKRGLVIAHIIPGSSSLYHAIKRR